MEALMTIEELRRDVADGFGNIDRRLDAVEQRFVVVDERFARIDERFDRMEERFDRRLREEHETMRRHFDVMVERIEAAVRIVAEGHHHLRTVVDNHEVRLQAIEHHE
jgi:hypothetical protein